MPFSTACSTPLSNFETGQNYQVVEDPAGVFFMKHLFDFFLYIDNLKMSSFASICNNCLKIYISFSYLFLIYEKYLQKKNPEKQT